MLEFIRNRAQAWLAWVIIIPVILSFALWGVHEYFTDSPEIQVAEVGDAKISQAVFKQAYQQHRGRLQEMLGRNFDPAMFNEEIMKNEVLDNLIEHQALMQGAKDAGIYIGLAQVGGKIRSLPELQNGGKFDKEQYLRLLGAQRLTPGGFEETMRNDMLVDQLRRGIMDSAFVTQQEFEAEVRVRDQQRDIGYMILPAANFQKQDPVTEEAIKNYYESNPQQFAAPELVSIQYVELSADELAKGVKLAEDEIRQSYEQRSAEFVTAEQRRASHILIQIAGEDPEAEAKKAREKIDELLARIRKGESFESLAKQYSQDPGSAKNGGDLGYFGKGIMDKAFESTAFTLRKGEISEPVRSAFGFHIIRVDDIKPGVAKPFDQVRTQIEHDLVKHKAEQLYAEQGETLANLAFEHPDSLESIVRELGLSVKTTEFFSRDNGVGIAASAPVRQAAFQDDVLQQAHNSEPVEIAPGHAVVVRIKEHKPAGRRSLAEARNEIVTQLQKNAAQAKAKEIGESVVKRAAQGEDVVKLAREYKLQWAHPGYIKRTDQAINREISTAVFRLERPSADKPHFEGIALASGDYAIVGLYGVKDGDVSAIAEDQRKTSTQSAARNRAEAEFKGYTEALKAQTSIKRHPENI